MAAATPVRRMHIEELVGAVRRRQRDEIVGLNESLHSVRVVRG